MGRNNPIWLVVNASSGSNSPAALEALHGCCGAQGLEVARVIRFPDEPVPAAADLDGAGIETLAIYAGDGTINAGVTGLYGWSGAVLVLPGGTMNLLALRLHGNATTEQIVASVASGGSRRVRPLVARTRRGDALAGLLAGPGTSWYAVREAMREVNVAGVIQGAGEALAVTTGGSMLHCREPALGRRAGYPLIELTPGEWGLQLDAYHAESAAITWRRAGRCCGGIREGPHDRLGLAEQVALEDGDGGNIGLLIDGEPADGSAREEIAVARCEVDLIATGHG